MDIIICTNDVDAIIAAKIGASNREMIHLYIDSKVKDYMKLWAVHQNQIMDRSIGRGNEPDKAWPIRAGGSVSFLLLTT